MRQEVLEQDGVLTALRQGLAARIGRDRFDLWFGSHVQWELEGETVVVTAPNDFVLDRLRRQFATDIKVAVQTVCGTSTRPEYRVDPELETNATAATVVSVRPSSTVTVLPRQPLLIQRTGDPSQPPPQSARRRPVLLSNFVVGAGNRVAYTAAQSTAQRLGAVSPLFFYGPSGCGKTHLLEGICTAARATAQFTRVLYLTAEQFTTHFLEALQGSGLPNFRRKCREVDLLAVDDVQFLAGKRATMLEFQHTLDALARQGRQVVVAADRAPAELSTLGCELATRLSGGLACGIEWADYETRLGIVRQLAHDMTPAIPDDVLCLIAAETTGDARQIRGALNRLRATSDALKQPISLELANQALQDIFGSSRRIVRLPDVERVVCEVFGIESKSLREGAKNKAVSQPRMLAMWLARKYTRAAFSEIGDYFGRRSHSTVISAERKVDQWVASGAKLQLGRAHWAVSDAIRRIETRLRTG